MPWTELLLPSLIATVLVFAASTVIHMVLQLHKSDYRKVPNEEEVRAAIRKGAPAPAQYMLPHCPDPKQAAAPEFQQKLAEGPVAILYVAPSGPIRMGKFLGAWIAYAFVVSLLAGYVAHSALLPGTPYLKVFQVVGAAAWLAYSWQSPSDSVWKYKPWSVTLRSMFDGLIYAALTAGSYAWLWPEA